MKKVIFILGFIIVSFCSYSQSKIDFQKKALAGLTFSFETPKPIVIGVKEGKPQEVLIQYKDTINIKDIPYTYAYTVVEHKPTGTSIMINGKACPIVKDVKVIRETTKYKSDDDEIINKIKCNFSNCGESDIIVIYNYKGYFEERIKSKIEEYFDYKVKVLNEHNFSYSYDKHTTIVRGTMTIVNPNDDNNPQQKNIFFVINKWDIRNSEALKLDEIVSALKENPDALVKISGYTDKVTGTAKRNKFLAEKRSEMVANYLINHGIDKSRIKSTSYGDTINPFNTPEENRVAVYLINNK